MLNDEALQITKDAFEWLEGFPQAANRSAKEREVAWFCDISMAELVRRTGTYEVVAALRMMLGPHGTHASRVDEGAFTSASRSTPRKKGGS